jgi:hypothetical protein
MTEDFLHCFDLMKMHQLDLPCKIKSNYSIYSTLIKKGKRNPGLYDGCPQYQRLHAPEDGFFPQREISHHTGIFPAVLLFPQVEFSHHARIFPVISPFSGPDFAAFIFKRTAPAGIQTIGPWDMSHPL